MENIIRLISFRPKKSLTKLLEKNFTWYVILFPFIFVLLGVIIGNFNYGFDGATSIDKTMFILKWILKALVLSQLYLFLFSLIFWLSNKIFKKQSRFKDTITILSYSTVPLIFGYILIIVVKIVLANVDNYVPYVGIDEWGYSIIKIIIALWASFIAIIGNSIVIKSHTLISIVPTLIILSLIITLTVIT